MTPAQQEEKRMAHIRENQLVQLELIRWFVKICEEEHLNYYMLDGTLLGAIRHKGFIPWDDDADFGMPRPDYERFLLVAEKYLPKGKRLATVWNTPGHICYFSKLEDTTKSVKIGGAMREKTEFIWIDIFPLDGMPNGRVRRYFHGRKLLFVLKLYTLSCFEAATGLHKKDRAWWNKIGVWICRTIPLYRLFDIKKQWKMLDKTLKRYEYKGSEYIINLMSGYKLKEMYPKSFFADGRRYEFESMLLRGPQDAKGYLTHLYGEDYMTPPPLSERNRHHTEYTE